VEERVRDALYPDQSHVGCGHRIRYMANVKSANKVIRAARKGLIKVGSTTFDDVRTSFNCC
jgi:hypothetical protein